MKEQPSTSKDIAYVREQLDKLKEELAGLYDITNQLFEARQGFYEKLILLDGATLTLLFTVIGGLSHSAPKAVLVHMGHHIQIGCWFLVLSIVLSIVHNHLNISFLIHMITSVKTASVHNRRILLRSALQNAGISHGLEAMSEQDADAARSLKSGTRVETWCRWIGPIAQLLTILAYVQFVAALRAVFAALS